MRIVFLLLLASCATTPADEVVWGREGCPVPSFYQSKRWLNPETLNDQDHKYARFWQLKFFPKQCK